MPDWLIDGNPTILLLLGVLALCAGVAWWKTRSKLLFVLASVSIAAIVAFIILDRVFESDREQIKRKITEVAAEVKRPVDLKKLFSKVSADFQYGPHDKLAFEKHCEAVIARYQIKELVVGDFRCEELSRPSRRAKVRFQFKVKGDAPGIGDGAFFTCKAELSLDPDDQWRLLTFRVFLLNSEDQQVHIPGLD